MIILAVVDNVLYVLYIVVYDNSLDKFNIAHCSIKVKDVKI